MAELILFPSSYFSVKKVDEDLQAEYDAVVKNGQFDIILFGYDQWFSEGRLVLTQIPEKMQPAIYRGWMMKPEQYRQFYHDLCENNIRLITTPEEYERFHIFPNVYEQLKEDTAKMVTVPAGEEIDVEKMKRIFERFMIKDYVKSVKGTNFPKYFDKQITQEEFRQWMQVFYQYRGGLLTGGLCVKEYLDLREYEGKKNEYRVFYINNKVATISSNSSQGSDCPMPPTQLVERYKNLSSPFYTIDYAELVDGSWKIIEAGDGSVSGLAEGQNYEAFYRILMYILS